MGLQALKAPHSLQTAPSSLASPFWPRVGSHENRPGWPWIPVSEMGWFTGLAKRGSYSSIPGFSRSTDRYSSHASQIQERFQRPICQALAHSRQIAAPGRTQRGKFIEFHGIQSSAISTTRLWFIHRLAPHRMALFVLANGDN